MVTLGLLLSIFLFDDTQTRLGTGQVLIGDGAQNLSVISSVWPTLSLCFCPGFELKYCKDIMGWYINYIIANSGSPSRGDLLRSVPFRTE